MSNQKKDKLFVWTELLKDTFNEFDQKAHLEWRFIYAIWATLIAVIVLLWKGEIVISQLLFTIIGIVVSLLILALQLYFISWIHFTHDRNRSRKKYLVKKILLEISESDKNEYEDYIRDIEDPKKEQEYLFFKVEKTLKLLTKKEMTEGSYRRDTTRNIQFFMSLSLVVILLISVFSADKKKGDKKINLPDITINENSQRPSTISHQSSRIERTIVGPFKEASAEIMGPESLKQIGQVTARMVERTSSGENVVCMIIGHYDKRLLNPTPQMIFGSNENLAYSRALWVRNQLYQYDLGIPHDHFIVLIGGSRSLGPQIPGHLLSEDRYVELIIISIPE